ncbi:MAG: flagellar biosynthesis protein FlhA [Deltaproteobacteria bacterium]|nr:flagellar biosynthesis protein FlhA [Deltaproteobacteria bacterium]
MTARRILESTIPISLLLILTILLFPMPAWFLDLCLAINIILAFVILFVSLYIDKPVEFSVYPSLLLITTVFRLALNVATTRRILLNGHEGLDVAGQLIMAFGQFLIQGNFIVGLIIFLIISIINLKVITKGAGRIAEVAARFTLDALPGKQMSIDSDLSAGIISEQEARERRKQLAKESEFYGAMDGAAKFVSGEALTGIFIMLLNIIGGFCIGYFQHDLSLGQAAQTFTILTVGDGLLSQIPAIIISVSAGLIVSRAASGEQFSLEILTQLGKTIWPLAFAAVSAISLGMLPGLPFLPFLFAGILVGFLAFLKMRKEKQITRHKDLHDQSSQENADPSKAVTTEDLLNLMEVSPATIHLGINLASQIGSVKIQEKCRKIRFNLASKYGFICPQVFITTLRGSKTGTKEPIRIYIKGNLVFETMVDTMRVLALHPPKGKREAQSDEAQIEISGEPTHDPVYKVPGYWIHKEEINLAKSLNYFISDQSTIFTTAVTEVLTNHMHELLRRQDVHQILSKIQKDFPKLVEDIIPQHISLAQFHQILSALLREYVSIRDMQTILEALGEVAPNSKNIEFLTEYVRKRLIKPSLQQAFENSTFLKVVNLEPQLENTIRNFIMEKDDSRIFVPSPKLGISLVNKIQPLYQTELQSTSYLVIMTPPDIRLPFFKWLKNHFTRIFVICPDEVPYGLVIKSLGVLQIEDMMEQTTSNFDSFAFTNL